MKQLVVTGTDTGIGKTVFSAALAAALGATYWKAIQSGIDSPTDTETVRTLGVIRTLPEAYRFLHPLSPHRAAELEDTIILPERLLPPLIKGRLLIEGAGGLLVPVTRELLFADLFARWQAPVILVARTALGTINHSLLSIEAMRTRDIPILGVAFVGERNTDNEATIAALGGVRRLGCLPWVQPLEARGLANAFHANFRLEDFC